ncbi:MAG: alpha/beta fold hydrolase, partial [Mycobacterium sp.]
CRGLHRLMKSVSGHPSLAAISSYIVAPTVVIHGSEDPMVRPRNGRNLARIIEGARYVVVDGMGHDLPEPVWRPVVEALMENFAAAGPDV